MEKISDEQLDVLISFTEADIAKNPRAEYHVRFLALTELKEQRIENKRLQKKLEHCRELYKRDA